ncbi:ABC transporter ATP-binding protein [Paenibacillus cymbidii]|uniref:ABC transporter ATP-binding protein n=1 Tax=Paenibacillus cymbidii TaxID=1639034 RepID=UPI001080607A|nr:ABC transporter ATP-binding protein [Paenibacillus cymbidii]
MVQLDNNRENKWTVRLIVRFVVWMFAIAPKRVTVLFVIQVVTSTVPGANIIIFSRIVEQAVLVYQGASHIESIILWIAAATALQVFSSFLRPLFSLKEDSLRQQLEEVALRGMQDKTNRLRLEALERTDFQDLLTRARRLAEPGFFFSMTNEFFMIIQSAMSVLSVSAVVIWWNPWLLFAICATTLPVPIVKWVEYRRKYTLEKKQIPEARLRNYLSGLMQSLAAAKEVRAFGMGEWLFSRWKELYWRVENDIFQDTRRHTIRYTSFYIFSVIGLAGAIAWCAASVSFGTLSTGRFSALLFGLENVSNGVRIIFERFGFMADRLQRIGDFFAYMDLEPEEDSVDKRKHRKSSPITLEGVSFQYPLAKKNAISDITFTIQPREKVALIGANGSGKTTLIKLLLGLYRPTSGKIRYGDIDGEIVDLRDLQSNIAVVFQDFNKYSVTVHDNIGFGNIAALDNIVQIRAAAARSGADELIAGLPHEYETLLTKRFTGGVDLSGGQWQKIAIARAFMRDTELISLDEPTAALDPKAESDVLHRFLEMAGAKTTILVSHRLGLARFCDRIILLKEGRITEQGTHDELLASDGEYALLWSLQSQWYRENEMKSMVYIRP